MTRSVTVAVLAISVALLSGCAVRRPGTFQVKASQPEYVVRSPEGRETAFEEVLGEFTAVGPAWVELRPQMELRIDRAYFRDGAVKRDLASYIGLERARYLVEDSGRLNLLPMEERLANRPSSQPGANQIIQPSASGRRHHRYFYQIAFSKQTTERTAVLLHATSVAELDRVTARLLADPDALCSGAANPCTVFPASCTVSLEMRVVVNGSPTFVIWGSRLASVTNHPDTKLFRSRRGKLVPVQLQPQDKEAFRVPLLPGDHVRWK